VRRYLDSNDPAGILCGHSRPHSRRDGHALVDVTAFGPLAVHGHHDALAPEAVGETPHAMKRILDVAAHIVEQAYCSCRMRIGGSSLRWRDVHQLWC